jgi:RNA polymerase sigma factor (sigma-70 family)
VKTALVPVDFARCEELADRASRGDDGAWKELVERLWPHVRALVRDSRAMSARRRSEDEVRDVVTRLFHKLGASNGRGLRLHFSWRERHPDKTFEDWLRIATKNALRDHLRERLGSRRSAAGDTPDEPSVKRLLNELATWTGLDDVGVRPPITNAQTARQLLEFARDRLPPDQHRALTAWLTGDSFEEIGASLGGATEDARRLVRAAIATLRRHFAGCA